MSTVPVLHGESIVLRLDKNQQRVALDGLGMGGHTKLAHDGMAAADGITTSDEVHRVTKG